jgi:hypothetical protein
MKQNHSTDKRKNTGVTYVITKKKKRVTGVL